MNKSKAQPSFFAKFKKGLTVSLKSIKFTWQHKKLMLFPLMTMIVIMSSLGIYELVYYQLYKQHITSFLSREENNRQEESSSHSIEQPELILFYCVITLIGIFSLAFFNVALSHATSQAFFEKPIDFGKSISHSIKKIATILVWTFSAFFVHMTLKFLKGEDDKGVSSFVMRLVGEAAEFAWYLATFLVVPVIAHENIGAFKSIRVSAHLFKKTFGENIAGDLVLQGLIPLIILFALLLAPFFGIILSMFFSFLFGPTIGTLFFLPFIAFIALMAVISCIFVSAAIIVFKTAVYHYTMGKPTGPFDTKEIVSSFVVDTKTI